MRALAREHSDFAWFKSRTESLPFDLTSGQAEIMGNTNEHGLLNPEMSQPTERAEHNLPPKSYAEATVQPLQEQQKVNQAFAQTNGHPKESGSSTESNGDGFCPAKREEKSLDEDRVIYAKHVDSNGTAIASVRPHPSYEEALKHVQEAVPRLRKKESTTQNKQDTTRPQLASGRRAGAGWERSAYVFIFLRSIGSNTIL